MSECCSYSGWNNVFIGLFPPFEKKIKESIYSVYSLHAPFFCFYFSPVATRTGQPSVTEHSSQLLRWFFFQMVLLPDGSVTEPFVSRLGFALIRTWKRPRETPGRAHAAAPQPLAPFLPQAFPFLCLHSFSFLCLLPSVFPGAGFLDISAHVHVGETSSHSFYKLSLHQRPNLEKPEKVLNSSGTFRFTELFLSPLI